MPIQGKFYTSRDLQEILGVSRQRVYNLAKDNDWLALSPGLYCAEEVEDYLLYRDIDPMGFIIRTYYEPEGNEHVN
jgi:hypothetical protein